MSTFETKLAQLLPLGSGKGGHQSVLLAAGAAKRAGIDMTVATDAILMALANLGNTRDPSTEVPEAVAWIYESTASEEDAYPEPTPMKALQVREMRDRFIAEGENIKLPPIDWSPRKQTINAMSLLYRLDDIICIGTFKAITARPLGDWSVSELNAADFYCVNPLNGQHHLTSTGMKSYRADDYVDDYRYFMVEFDDLPLDKQLAFWMTVPLPVAMLTYSGGKSIHAIIKIWFPCESAQDYRDKVKLHIFTDYLGPMGADITSCNPSRLTRMPGHFRVDKGRQQDLLYINHNARPNVSIKDLII